MEPINWLSYGALALNAVLIPLLANLLKGLWAQAPSWVKTFIPLIAGSLIVIAEAKLAEFFGAPIDLTLIEQILVGGLGGGTAATVAYKMGKGATSNR